MLPDRAGPTGPVRGAHPRREYPAARALRSAGDAGVTQDRSDAGAVARRGGRLSGTGGGSGPTSGSSIWWQASAALPSTSQTV